MEPVLPYNEAAESGEMPRQKSRRSVVRGWRFFSRPLRKNTTRPLTVWIGGTDGEVLIVLGGWLWHNKVDFLVRLLRGEVSEQYLYNTLHTAIGGCHE